MISTLLAASTLGISGTYIEMRTCSIFAGPCHYSGEMMTDGRSAVAIFQVESGSYQGISLSGVKAALLVNSEENLVFQKPTKSILFLDGASSPSKKQALIQLLQKQLGNYTNNLQDVRDAEIVLTTDNNEISVRVKDSRKPVYDALITFRECTSCTMPGVLWYRPLSPGVESEIATVEKQTLHENVLEERWVRMDERAAFVGSFHW
ncbi:MAG TPA: DUF1326 domain-containing protein [Fimbriimonadales bacterium]|nr:DUF1326 domain-containing protein [Fimbriimonadales bacterium]